MSKFVGVNEYSQKVYQLFYKGCLKTHKKALKRLRKLKKELKKEIEKLNKSDL